MMATDLIDKLQVLIDNNGDAEIHIYQLKEMKTIPIKEVFYDDEIKDICISIYP